MTDCTCTRPDEIREFDRANDCYVVVCNSCGDEIERIYHDDEPDDDDDA